MPPMPTPRSTLRRSSSPLARPAARLVALLVVVAAAACSSVGRPLPPAAEVAALGEPPVDRNEYRLQVGDMLQIDFPYQPSEKAKLPIRPDGKISLDGIGEFVAEGLTAPELEGVIRDKSTRRFRDPEVVVVVSEFGERRVYVGGEVKRPGYVRIQDGMTPLQAVLAAGGFDQGAARDAVLYAAPARNGQYHATRLDLEDVVVNGTPETIRLAGNDVVFVPRSRIGNANEFIQVYVRNMLPIETRAGANVPLNAGN